MLLRKYLRQISCIFKIKLCSTNLLNLKLFDKHSNKKMQNTKYLLCFEQQKLWCQGNTSTLKHLLKKLVKGKIYYHCLVFGPWLKSFFCIWASFFITNRLTMRETAKEKNTLKNIFPRTWPGFRCQPAFKSTWMLVNPLLGNFKLNWLG